MPFEGGYDLLFRFASDVFDDLSSCDGQVAALSCDPERLYPRVGQLRANSMQFICDLYTYSRHLYLFKRGHEQMEWSKIGLRFSPPRWVPPVPTFLGRVSSRVEYV